MLKKKICVRRTRYRKIDKIREKNCLAFGPIFADYECPSDHKNAQMKYSMCFLERNFHFFDICTENYLKIDLLSKKWEFVLLNLLWYFCEANRRKKMFII